MRLIRKVAKIIKSGGVSSHARREPPGKAERAQAVRPLSELAVHEPLC